MLFAVVALDFVFPLVSGSGDVLSGEVVFCDRHPGFVGLPDANRAHLFVSNEFSWPDALRTICLLVHVSSMSRVGPSIRKRKFGLCSARAAKSTGISAISPISFGLLLLSRRDFAHLGSESGMLSALISSFEPVE